MKIYLDNDFRCHLEDDGTMRAYELENNLFEGKCNEYIKGYRIVPEGETWIRSDGRKFKGLMIAPARDYAILAELQEQYEGILVEAQAAYENGVNSI
jgi:hypothetical protein